MKIQHIKWTAIVNNKTEIKIKYPFVSFTIASYTAFLIFCIEILHITFLDSLNPLVRSSLFKMNMKLEFGNGQIEGTYYSSIWTKVQTLTESEWQMERIHLPFIQWLSLKLWFPRAPQCGACCVAHAIFESWARFYMRHAARIELHSPRKPRLQTKDKGKNS